MSIAAASAEVAASFALFEPWFIIVTPPVDERRLSAACSCRSEQPLRRDPRAVPQARELGPDDVLGHPPPSGRGVETAIGAGQHPRRIADNGGDALEALGHHFRVLHKI